MAIRVFPVAAEGHPHFTDDFGVVRPGRGAHKGNDIFADEGTPIVAVDDGPLEFREDPLGGHAFYLHALDGTVYYGAHLTGYEGTSPRNAVAGEIVGYVGMTGNAASTSPHLHFEVHPSGGAAVDPYRLLTPLTPSSVTSSLGVTNVPPAPPAPHDPLPPIPVVPGPVPPIPHAPAARRRGGGGLVAAVAIGGLLLAAARRSG